MDETGNRNLSECKRCGTCCIKGGPSLHHEDRDLLTNGPIKYEHLISIRKGEMALSPRQDEAEPVRQELIKIAGKGKDWECAFWGPVDHLCTIYEQRPLECRLLQCWDSSALEEVAGRNTLARADVIDPDNPVNVFIRFHELRCPVPAPDTVRTALSAEAESREALAELTELVRADLAIRTEAVAGLDLPLPLELFYFGRPIHVLLNAHGLCAVEKDGVILLGKDAAVP